MPLVLGNGVTQETLLKSRFVIFRCQKYVKKRVHKNHKKKLPWDFKKVSWVTPFPTTPSHRLFLANKPDNLNLRVQDTITGTEKSKLLVKHISCDCWCTLDDKYLIQNKNWIMIKSKLM